MIVSAVHLKMSFSRLSDLKRVFGRCIRREIFQAKLTIIPVILRTATSHVGYKNYHRFELKLLVWLAHVMKGDTYLKECI